jgi:transcriptional regulator GlxA family with amidase domain
VGHRVVIVTYPGIQALDLVGPMDVFTGAAGVIDRCPPDEATAYRVEVASAAGGPLRTGSGLTLHTEALPEGDAPIDTLLVVGGLGVHDARRDERLVPWLRDAVPRAGRVGSVCTGAFLLADVGALDGCPVTTHWARAERLAAEHPELDVDPDPIYTRSGRVWTSAGVSAGIDLALAMVEDDHGTDVAQTVARWLVMFRHRPGGQTQFATPVWTPRAERSALRAVQQAVEDDPGADHRVTALAARAAMSPRHFTRVFTREVGRPPGHWVEQVRVDAARRLLTDTADTVAVIARRCGFGSAETMRRAFVRRVGVPPDHYRCRFAVVA